jgi:hypothetical protein
MDITSAHSEYQLPAPDCLNRDEIGASAAGALAAQKCVHALTAENADPGLVWLCLARNAAVFGWDSPAIAAFCRELGKQIR